MRRPAAVLLAAAVALVSARARADDVLHVGTANVDPPTVVTLGVQLLVSGDANHDARVGVRYRPLGSPDWKIGMDLFRVRPESVIGRVVPEQFAGSIFELRPATSYEIELHATDPDGPVDETVVVQATTRAPPADPASPTVRPVSDAAAFQAALDAAVPGDVITLADGTYAGSFDVSANGTSENPIVIRGAADGAVLDGRGCTGCNLLEVDGSFVHVERLTLQDAVRGLRFKTAGTQGNVARRVHLRDVQNGIVGDPDQRDFYLCDNVLEGRLTWPLVYDDDGGRHSGSDDGINVQGFGHVVCHNQLVGFGDAMKVEQDGARADDFYGNEVLSAYDNAIELDRSEGNTRAFRNRFTNTFVPISFQPIFGGPAYAIRNVVVNVAEDQLKFYALRTTPPEEPSGVLVLQNTFVGPAQALLMASTATSHHFAVENNLFVGKDPPGPAVVQWSGPMDDGTFDWNGWLPDGVFDFGPAGAWASFAAMQAAGVVEPHGTLVASGVFASGLVPPPTYKVTMPPTDVTPASGSNAIDAGGAIANVDDGFTGAAPDLGAVEAGCPAVLYGPRPDGIDETTEPYGCGGPVVTSTTTTTLPWVTIETTALSLSDDPVDPAKRRFAFRSATKRDPAEHRIVPPIAGTQGDPTLGGATLVIYDAAGSGEETVVSLPVAGWSGRGDGGWRFRDRDAAAPVSSVAVRRDRIVLKGGRAAFGYTLDEPAQGALAVRLTLGGDRPWCAAAPGRIDVAGRFVAVPRTPAPLDCPALP